MAQDAVHVDATGGGNSLYMGDKHEGKQPGHNNYGRPEGQNVGNFLTDRNSSRVLAPPGKYSTPHAFVRPIRACEDPHLQF